MKRSVTFLLALIFVVVIGAFMTVETVRFTERAVLTTFGRADEGAIRGEGLLFKAPFPIQSVTKYDTRLRFAEARLETQQTADNRQITVQAYCVWRVADPLKFFQNFSPAGSAEEDHFRMAQDKIVARLRNAMGATSRYRMDQLFTTDPAGSALPALETEILSRVRAGGVAATGSAAAPSSGEAPGETALVDGSLSELGIEAVAVGISRVSLPENTTRAVFTAMAANQDKLAKELQTSGEALATQIRSEAEATASMIRGFANRRAEEIRARGDQEAATYLAQMDANPELAVFLRQIEFVRTALARRTTLILPTTLPGVNLLSPQAVADLRPGELPRAADLARVNPADLLRPPAPQPQDQRRGPSQADEQRTPPPVTQPTSAPAPARQAPGSPRANQPASVEPAGSPSNGPANGQPNGGGR